MRNKRLAWLIAAVVGGVGGAAQGAIYNGDLLVGFTRQAGTDLIYDLGTASSLVNGQTWNLATLLGGFNLTTVSWGVIGDKTGTPRVAWTTTGGATPPIIGNNAKWATLDTPTKSIYQFFSAAGSGQSLSLAATDDNSWNQQAINGSLTTQYHNAYEDPTVVGLSSARLFAVLANGSAPTLLGTFTLSSSGVLTFSTSGPSLPPAPQLSVSRTGNAASISFVSASGATYSLCYTNSTGLTAPASSWPVAAGTISGDGTVKTFLDTTTDPNRFYKVKAQ